MIGICWIGLPGPYVALRVPLAPPPVPPVAVVAVDSSISSPKQCDAALQRQSTLGLGPGNVVVKC